MVAIEIVSVVYIRSVHTDLSNLENMPLSCFILEIHAELISVIIAISRSGRSEITHVQTSIPAEIAEGVKASSGSATE